MWWSRFESREVASHTPPVIRSRGYQCHRRGVLWSPWVGCLCSLFVEVSQATRGAERKQTENSRETEMRWRAGEVKTYIYTSSLSPLTSTIWHHTLTCLLLSISFPCLIYQSHHPAAILSYHSISSPVAHHPLYL